MTVIKLHNTKTRKKEDFIPIDASNVRMYVCGPTVYDRAHLGNARPVVVFDVLYRLLRHVYGADHVTYVRNFTDVDDKIIARAQEDKRDIGDITSETTQWFLDDMAALGALKPDHMPRATEYIPQMVAMIEDLIAREHAYVAEGHVLFAVESYEKYGALSGRSIKDMIAGARVEVAPYKRNPMDFVLWKPSTGDQPGWESPWGFGRPGWHIECSAMSYELLGDSFDIHGGGNDLMFPHHENEIAQSCCAYPKADFARYWLHNEMLQVEGKKMSKSLGNFFTVHDLLEGHDGQPPVPGEVIRFVFLSTHYRKPMDWTEKKAKEAEATLRKWRTLIASSRPDANAPEELVLSLSDDLNTPQAITILHKLAKDGNGAALMKGAEILGLLTPEMGEWFNFGEISISGDKRIDRIIEIRAMARDGNDYDTSDKIRGSLNDIGVAVLDKKSGCAAYFEPQFLVRQLMSDANNAWDDGDEKQARNFVERAQSAGIKIHFETKYGPSAVSGFDAERANKYFESHIEEVLKYAEGLKWA